MPASPDMIELGLQALSWLPYLAFAGALALLVGGVVKDLRAKDEERQRQETAQRLREIAAAQEHAAYLARRQGNQRAIDAWKAGKGR